jgi:diaminohydroxyphosphoribosylaminopyrimidine deaminase/5-amino-6-(5-phosphoribosylamino)uracil reductase
MSNVHKKWMNLAILEAIRSKGITGKNPPVGCVIAKNNIFISSGRTSSLGRPHAEENAINKVLDKNILLNATIYVTLEPCSHKNTLGKSCADLIIETGINEVFICCVDPDQRTNGKSINLFKKNNIKVHSNFMEKEASDIYDGFFSRLLHEKPFVTMKIACSLDGKIALKNKQSKWITNELSRRSTHLIRAQNDAILTSSSTITIDNPMLNCRLEGMGNRSPAIVILDRFLKLDYSYKVFQHNLNNNIYLYSINDSKSYLSKLDNVKKIIVDKSLNNRHFFNFIFKDLSKKGINNLLIESGSQLSTTLLSLNLVDKLIIYRSGKIIGNDGLPFINDLNHKYIDKLKKYKISFLRTLDDDVLEIRNHSKEA